MQFTVAVLALLPAVAFGARSPFVTADAEQCCVAKCAEEGETKFYSVVDNALNHHCGECCMKASDYDLYHKFEKNLLPAAEGQYSPCADEGYSVYDETETHGTY